MKETMLNKEFYKDQLEDLLIAGQTHAICSFKKKHIKECVKYCEDKGIGGCITCQETFKNWLYAIHNEPIKITMFEKLLLETFIEKGYLYIARDKSNKLWVFKFKPVKRDDHWRFEALSNQCGLPLFEDLFQFIRWQNEAGTHLQTLLDICEVIEND